MPHSGQTVAADGEQLVRVKREGKGTLGEAKGHIEVRMGPTAGVGSQHPTAGVGSQQGGRRGQRRMQRAARWGGVAGRGRSWGVERSARGALGAQVRRGVSEFELAMPPLLATGVALHVIATDSANDDAVLTEMEARAPPRGRTGCAGGMALACRGN